AAQHSDPEAPSISRDALYFSGRVLQRQSSGPVSTFEQRIARIDDLLSYGLFDWVITDAEATEAFQLLRAMSTAERTRALPRIRLDRLINNLPDRFQPELAKIVAESGGEQTVQAQVQSILTYSFFDWVGSVSASGAGQALGLLEASPVDQRDHVLVRISPERRKRLYDALPPRGKARLLEMWHEREQREIERQLDRIRTIERGERLLMRVLLTETKEPLEAFAPEGIGAEVNEDG